MSNDALNNAIKQKIKQYRREIRQYTELVTILVTLKKAFSMVGNEIKARVSVHVESTLQYKNPQSLKIPDLIVLEHDMKKGSALDHKSTRATSVTSIEHIISDVQKYKGIIQINNEEYDITDTFMIISDENLKEIDEKLFSIIKQNGYEIAIISYSIISDKLIAKLRLHNPNNIRFSSRIINHFFVKKTRNVDIPTEAHYSYKFVREKPPLSYLLVEIYHLILGGGINPLEPIISVRFDSLLQRVKTYYPRWITIDEQYEQIPKNRLHDALFHLKKLEIIEMEGNIIKTKKPRKTIDEYILTKLARWELKQEKNIREKKKTGYIKLTKFF